MTETIEKESKVSSINDHEFWNEIEFQESKRKNINSSRNTIQYINLQDLYNSVSVKIPKVDDVVRGVYIGIESGYHCFSVDGFKDYVWVSDRASERKYISDLQFQNEIDILIINVNNDLFFIEGSISEMYENAAHLSLKLDEDAIISGRIKSLNPAGYDVEIIHDGVTLSGFMPNTLAGINKLHDPESIVGLNLYLMIESFSKEEGTYIVSRRKYLKTLIPSAIEGLKTDTVYEGHVTGTTDFGIFIEFEECLTGMIHKANVIEEWRNRLSEIKPGTQIQFYVKEIIKDKIILTQILRKSLWDTIKPNQVLNGSIKDKKQFGLLISLDDETMGLIHNSEIEKIENKSFMNKKSFKVKVLSVDRQNRKIFLTVS